MRKPTDVQLRLLARIKMWGVEVSFGTPESADAIARLLTPHFTFERVRISTFRVLVRDGLVDRLPKELDELGRDNVWHITREGVDLLEQYPECLADAHLHASALDVEAYLSEIGSAHRRHAAS